MFKRPPLSMNVVNIVLNILIMALVLFAGSGQSFAEQVESQSPAASSDVTANKAGDPAKKAGGGDAQSIPLSPAEIKTTTPSSVSEQWAQRYENLVGGLNDQSLGDEDADLFYQELTVALREMRNLLRGALSGEKLEKPEHNRAIEEKTESGSQPKNITNQDLKNTSSLPNQTEEPNDRFYNLQQLKSQLSVLYTIRIQAIAHVSPGLRKAVTGTGVEGVLSFKEEVDYFLLTLHVNIKLLPEFGRRKFVEVLSAPTPVIWFILKLVAVFLVFLWWRRWAAQGISRIRHNILDTKPLNSIHKWVAKLLWYLMLVRKPIEWGVVLWVTFNVISTSESQLIYQSLWVKAKWILSIWFTAVLVGAMFTKGTRKLNSQSAALRLRSIRIIAIWLLISGLGLSIVGDFYGQGTSYSWYWVLCKLFALFTLFLLIRWWREEIYRLLTEILQQPAYIQKILRYNQGFIKYLGTVFGAAYLVVIGFRKWVLKRVSAFEGGRYFIANLTRLEAMRASERLPQKTKDNPIPDEIRHGLFEDEGGLVESVAQDFLEQMLHLVEPERKGGAAVIAEQGGGKTHLFERLKNRFENKMLAFECPPGGIDPVLKKFAESLELDASDLTIKAISDRLQERQIKVVAIDSLHRLSRPAFGGQRDLDQLGELISPIRDAVFWFYGINWAAWHYISRVRASRLFLDDILRLPKWTEDQIRELIEMRSSQVGFEPDFSELILPSQFDDIDYDTVEDRNRFGFYRILWNASDGNPMVALHLWADSLRIAPDNRTLVSLPQLPTTSELEKVSMTMLLTLRVIAQSETANQEEIVESLRLPIAEISGALHLAETRKWIESIDGRYRITWKWFRSITQVLARNNMLVRTTPGG
jgi:hypothetical protein